MDWQNPLRTIAPTVDADVLRTLARTQSALTGRQVSKLAERSYAQVAAVLTRLTEAGLVASAQHGRTYSYHLNHDHVLAEAVISITRAADTTEQLVRDAITDWTVAAVSVSLFGSVARREASEQSDIDLLIVHPDDVSDRPSEWHDQVDDLIHMVESLCGNMVHVVELSESEVREAVATAQPLVESRRADARTLFGTDVHDLLRGDVA